jgi:hypothetical protein
MKLRFALPVAAVAAAAIALSSGSAGADTAGICPDHFSPTIIVFNPDWASKDHNGNFIVCHKDVPGAGDPTKDDHGFIIQTIDDPNDANWTDDL